MHRHRVRPPPRADHRRVDWGGGVALWVGSETGDLPVNTSRFEGVTISMEGRVESLNVAVATSILLFEAAGARRGLA